MALEAAAFHGRKPPRDGDPAARRVSAVMAFGFRPQNAPSLILRIDAGSLPDI
jgi:hypothetical protein